DGGPVLYVPLRAGELVVDLFGHRIGLVLGLLHGRAALGGVLGVFLGFLVELIGRAYVTLDLRRQRMDARLWGLGLIRPRWLLGLRVLLVVDEREFVPRHLHVMVRLLGQAAGHVA